MTTRERWIIYPLLFLSLGASLRDKIIPPVRGGNSRLQFVAGNIAAEKIICSEMQIIGHEGKPVAVFKVDPNSHVSFIKTGRIACSELNVNGPNGKPVVVVGSDAKTTSGFLETRTSKEIPLVQLRSNEDGGFITTIGREGRIGLMGHTPQDFGLFAQMPQTGWAVPIVVWPGHPKNIGKGDPTPSNPAPTPPQEKKQP